jgi:hypothetical protein
MEDDEEGEGNSRGEETCISMRGVNTGEIEVGEGGGEEEEEEEADEEDGITEERKGEEGRDSEERIDVEGVACSPR